MDQRASLVTAAIVSVCCCSHGYTFYAAAGWLHTALSCTSSTDSLTLHDQLEHLNVALWGLDCKVEELDAAQVGHASHVHTLLATWSWWRQKDMKQHKVSSRLSAICMRRATNRHHHATANLLLLPVRRGRNAAAAGVHRVCCEL